MFKQTVSQVIKERDTTGKEVERVEQIVNSPLAIDCLAYIQRQLNNSSFLGYITTGQHELLLRSSIRGLFKLVYVKHYQADEDLIDKDPIYESCKNLLILLWTRPLLGRDRQLELARLDAQRQQQIIVKQ